MSTTAEPLRKRKITIPKPTKPKLWRIQNLRRVSQILFLGLFLVLLALTVLPLRSPVPVDIFFRADPLVALTAMIASRRVVASMVTLSAGVLILTVLLGRFFCGWVCPMGTAVDLSDRFLVRKKKDEGQSPCRNLKYYLLGALLVGALFSAQVTYLFDPLSLITRTVIWVLVSPILMAARFLVDQGWISRIAPSLTQTPLIPEVQPYFRMNLVAALLFGGILALGLISRRFWCRNLCPLGALLGLFSKWGLVRRQVKEGECLECRRCDRECKMGAILPNPRDYQATECIYCYNCVPICGPRSTAIPLSFSREGFHSKIDLKRRRLIGAFGMGLVWVGLAKGDVGTKRAGNSPIKTSSPYLIRPPGSCAEAEFLDRCTRCGLCMKACPTNGLQPALTEGGLEGFWTPILVPRVGYCSQHCILCGQVCPTDAIQPFTEQEKNCLFIGRAAIDRSQCLVWAQDKECLVCDEVCSYRALYWKVVDGRRRPFVEEVKCTGCGECENKCPIQPHAAIRITSIGDLRHLSRKEQRQVRYQKK